MIENDPQVLGIIRKAEADIKNMTGCEIHIAIDSFEIRVSNKELLKNIVCLHYNNTWERIVSRGRPRELSDAMFIYMFIAHKHLKCSLSEIGRDCGNRHHATVINALSQLDNYIAVKDPIVHDIEAIKQVFINKRML